MSLLLQEHQTSASLTASENALLNAFIYQLDFAYYSYSLHHRDNTVLFSQSTEEFSSDRLLSHTDELKIAFIADPKTFINVLVQQSDDVQQTVAQWLCSESQTSDALLHIVASTLASERKRWTERPDYYTEEEYALLVRITDNIQMLPAVPEPSDPDPEEYAQWLADQQLAEIENQDTFPTMTTPSTIEPSEKNTSNYRLLSTVFLCIGAFAIGIPIGSRYVNRKNRSAKAEEPSPQLATDEEDFLWEDES
jgi:hypothetical protein